MPLVAYVGNEPISAVLNTVVVFATGFWRLGFRALDVMGGVYVGSWGDCWEGVWGYSLWLW